MERRKVDEEKRWWRGRERELALLYMPAGPLILTWASFIHTGSEPWSQIHVSRLTRHPGRTLVHTDLISLHLHLSIALCRSLARWKYPIHIYIGCCYVLTVDGLSSRLLLMLFVIVVVVMLLDCYWRSAGIV